MATKAHLEGNKRYLEKLDHITIRVQGGTKEKIKARAQQEGMSLNAYINALIQADMGEHLTPGVVKNLEGDADPVE